MKKWREIKRAGNASMEQGFRTAATTSMWLIELRRQAGLTQVDLAERLGVSQGWISQIESGTDVHVSTVAAYMAVLGGGLQFTATLPNRVAVDLQELPPTEPEAALQTGSIR
jgi:transcriptional regulator with XRE-family HTH domain